MPSKRYNAVVIIHKLGEADVLLGQGQNVSGGCKQLGVSEQTDYRWRCHYNTIRPHSALGYRPPAPETTPPEKLLTTINQAA